MEVFTLGRWVDIETLASDSSHHIQIDTPCGFITDGRCNVEQSDTGSKSAVPQRDPVTNVRFFQIVLDDANRTSFYLSENVAMLCSDGKYHKASDLSGKKLISYYDALRWGKILPKSKTQPKEKLKCNNVCIEANKNITPKMLYRLGNALKYQNKDWINEFNFNAFGVNLSGLYKFAVKDESDTDELSYTLDRFTDTHVLPSLIVAMKRGFHWVLPSIIAGFTSDRKFDIKDNHCTLEIYLPTSAFSFKYPKRLIAAIKELCNLHENEYYITPAKDGIKKFIICGRVAISKFLYIITEHKKLLKHDRLEYGNYVHRLTTNVATVVALPDDMKDHTVYLKRCSMSYVPDIDRLIELNNGCHREAIPISGYTGIVC